MTDKLRKARRYWWVPFYGCHVLMGAYIETIRSRNIDEIREVSRLLDKAATAVAYMTLVAALALASLIGYCLYITYLT